MRMDTQLTEKHTLWLLFLKNDLFYFLLIVMLLVLPAFLSCNEEVNYESICIVASSSGKETLTDYGVIHGGEYYPLFGDRREGCLIIFSYYAHDLDGDGIKDRGAEYARFVDDDYDHCCVTGQ